MRETSTVEEEGLHTFYPNNIEVRAVAKEAGDPGSKLEEIWTYISHFPGKCSSREDMS